MKAVTSNSGWCLRSPVQSVRPQDNREIDDMSWPSDAHAARFTYKVFNRRTTDKIWRNFIERAKRSTISTRKIIQRRLLLEGWTCTRLFMPVTCSVTYVRQLWIVHFQAELGVSMHVTVSGFIKTLWTHKDVSYVRPNASNPETIVPDAHHNFSNTHPIISEVQNEVTDTHTISNLNIEYSSQQVERPWGCRWSKSCGKIPLMLWLLLSNHSLPSPRHQEGCDGDRESSENVEATYFRAYRELRVNNSL